MDEAPLLPGTEAGASAPVDPEACQVPLDIRTAPATAYTPGSGPSNRRCTDCAHFLPSPGNHGYQTGRCLLWAQMHRIDVSPEIQAAAPRAWWRNIPVIARNTASCLYFAQGAKRGVKHV